METVSKISIVSKTITVTVKCNNTYSYNAPVEQINPNVQPQFWQGDNLPKEIFTPQFAAQKLA
jgi:hypothetical protein